MEAIHEKALNAKNKLGFVDGLLPQPLISDRSSRLGPDAITWWCLGSSTPFQRTLRISCLPGGSVSAVPFKIVISFAFGMVLMTCSIKYWIYQRNTDVDLIQH